MWGKEPEALPGIEDTTDMHGLGRTPAARGQVSI